MVRVQLLAEAGRRRGGELSSRQMRRPEVCCDVARWACSCLLWLVQWRRSVGLPFLKLSARKS
jgi:hypothetical protein